MILEARHSDPCTHKGHEAVLSFLSTYCDNQKMTEDTFKWDDKSMRHLNHIQSCPYCLARVFSTPCPILRSKGNEAIRYLQAV